MLAASVQKSITIEESDGSPSVTNPSIVVMAGATVVDDGGGQITVTPNAVFDGGTFSENYIYNDNLDGGSF